jgi:hypothetical protein
MFAGKILVEPLFLQPQRPVQLFGSAALKTHRNLTLFQYCISANRFYHRAPNLLQQFVIFPIS